MNQTQNSIEEWWPFKPAIYDINKTYLDNAENGPFFPENEKIPARYWAPKEKWIDFLGHKVASPIGVPAGPLLNSKWIGLAAELGYDVLVYKTIRSCEHPGHALPNMIYVDIPNEKELFESKEKIVYSTPNAQQKMKDLAVTNSFGMPSRTPDYLKKDIPLAASKLKEGQTLVVSVVGSPFSEKCAAIPSLSSQGEHNNKKSAEELSTEFLKDFVETALLAKECGAKIVEANFSCPNVSSGEGQIYQNPKTVFEIGSALVQALGNEIPLIIKVGNYENKELMSSVFDAASKAKIAAICGLNSVSMKVLDPASKKAALGEKRINSGVCGGPIRNAAVRFVENAREILLEKQKKTPQDCQLKILGCGGITLPEHFDEFMQAGSPFCISAMTATGMMWDPLLALRWHQQQQKKN